MRWQVPSLFQDNFDYGDIRRDFVHGVLTSDLLMKNIYCYIAKDGYAARVKDTKSYDSIRLTITLSWLLSSTNPAFSKDILSRWTFPLVPDDNHPGGHSYEHLRGNKYIAADGSVILSRCVCTTCRGLLTTFSLVTSHRTCKIGNQILIGSKSQIADNAQIVTSVLGQRCIIGAGSVVRNSYLFDDVVVGPNCAIEYSIIGADVQIKEMSRVERGCLIAGKVTIGPNARLEPFQKLLKKCQDDHEDEEDEDGGAGEDEDSEADNEEGEDEEENESEEEEDSDYEEVETSKRQPKPVCLILMSCFRSGSRCARKTWARIQCDYMA
jgi:translation initiation factor eIF-2B subunit epsilon